MPESYRNPGGKSTRSNTFSQKWGDDPFTALGHTQVPNALMQYAARLKLAPDECWLITCLLLFKRGEADPYPSQDTLTALYGRSVDTVQRVVKSICAKGLMTVQHKRSELGHFSHIVYDFVPLRIALNECYYQDHPESRPQYSQPIPMPQGCGTAEGEPRNKSHTARMRYGTDAVRHAAKTPKPMPHGCGANQTPKKKFEKDIEKDAEFFASRVPDPEGNALDGLPPAEFAALEAAARARVITEMGDPIRTLARQGKAQRDVRRMMRQMLAEQES